jgi:hypothetical protein
MCTTPDQAQLSDVAPAPHTDPRIVMAEQNTQDVVKEARSTGDVSPVDVNATSTKTTAGNGTALSGPAPHESKSEDAPVATSSNSERGAAVNTIQPSEKAGGDTTSVSGGTLVYIFT